MTLKDQRIVILGGTSGIGFATAEAAAREGASVVIASSTQARVERAVAALPAGTEGRVADLSEESQIRELFAGIGPFDHLVYTAGEPLQLTTLDTFDFAAARGAWNLRYWGPFMAARHASPRIRPGGSIVLTTGVAKDRPLKGWTLASSICGAVDALTRALAIELAPIRVNAVSPGVVRTALWNPMSDADREAFYRDVGSKLPVGRVGEASDIAETYLYLMREAFSTGQIITVDGGTVLV